MTKSLVRVAGFVALMAFGSATQAADIVWSAPTDATGNASDVVTEGFLVAARTTGPATTLNGVTFLHPFSQQIVLSGVDTITNGFSAPNFSNASYNDLVGTGAYSSSASSFKITISGLTSGQKYLVQLFNPFWNFNWATAYTGGANTSGLVNLSGPDVGAGASTVPQNVVGRFTATGTTQEITTSSPTQYVLLAAAQVRAVPEPESWMLLITGFGLTGAAMRRRRAVAFA
jgi:hypothetical protein